jgi:hypothetical protein
LASFLLCFVAGRGDGKGFYETSFGESTYIFRIFQLQGFNLGCSIAGEMNRIILILIIAASLKVSGQTITNKNETITVTNWVKPGPYLRVLDSVTYNVAYSKKWAKFETWERLGIESLDPGEGWTKSHFVLGNYQVIGNVTFITIMKQQMQYNRDNPGDFPQPLPAQDDHVVAVLHCEDPHKSNFFCARTKDVLDAKGVAFRAYDCGIQSTNLVPEIKRVKAIKPN